MSSEFDLQLDSLEKAHKDGQTREFQIQMTSLLDIIESEADTPEQVRFFTLCRDFHIHHGQWSAAYLSAQKVCKVVRNLKDDEQLQGQLRLLAQLAVRAGQPTEAETALSEMMFKLKSSNSPLLLSHLVLMADFALFCGSPQRAHNFMSEACSLEPTNCRLRLDLANILDRLHRYDEAAQIRNSLQMQAPFESRYEQVKSLERRSLWGQALTELEPLVSQLVSLPQTTPASEALKYDCLELKAQLLIATDQGSEAEVLMVSLYQDLMGKEGMQSLRSARAAANLARYWQSTDRIAEAEQGFAYAHSVFHQQLGETHHKTQVLCDRIIECAIARKDFGKAQHLTTEAMKARSRDWGLKHPLVANSLNMLGRIWLEQRQFDDARDVLFQAKAIYDQYPNTGDFNLVLVHYGIGAALQGCYKYYEAEEYYQKALEVLENYYPPTHRILPLILKNYGWLLRQTGRDKAATDKFSKAEKLLSAGNLH